MMHYHSYYRGFTDEQFAADEYFQQWVLSANGQTDEFWQSYLNLNPMEETTIRNARKLVEDLAENNYNMLPLTKEEKAALKQDIYQRLGITDEPVKPVNLFRKKRTYRWLAAAAILGIIAASAFLLVKPVAAKQEASFVQEIADTKMKEIVLPDSSVVILNAGSSLKYNDDFLNQPDRKVYLDGNAFFKVRKDIQHKQFIVYAKSIAITVLGTQFNVNARSSSPEVGLTSGKVKITETGNADSAFMLPGEKIKLDTVQQALIKSKLDTQLYAAWTENKWIFRQTSLEDITNLISEYYGVSAEFKNDKYRQLKITAVIPVTDLQILNRILSKTLHIDIKQIDRRLIIE